MEPLERAQQVTAEWDERQRSEQWTQAPPAGYPGTIFDLRIDAVNKPKVGRLNPAEYIEKGVTHAAVVCDLCSTIPGKVPACVNACPHDAAMRVNAQTEFPTE